MSHLLALLAEQKQKKQIEAINRRAQSNKQRVEGGAGRVEEGRGLTFVR